MNHHWTILVVLAIVGLSSCCDDNTISLQGRLVDGITGDPIAGQMILISHEATFTFSCGPVDEETITTAEGSFAFDFTQGSPSQFFLWESTYPFIFGRNQIRVTDEITGKVWENGRFPKEIMRPSVPNDTDLNTVVLAELLPIIIVSPFKSSDSSKVVDQIVIPELGLVIDELLQNPAFDKIETFGTAIENEFQVTIKYKDGTVKDSTYQHNIITDNGILSIPY